MTQYNNTISKKAVLILDLLLFFYYLCFHLCLSVCLLGLPLITVILLLIGLSPMKIKVFIHSCCQDVLKSIAPIFMYICGRVGHRPLHFG